MARVTMTKELAGKIAQEYAKSGFGSKSDALIASGLSPEYSKSQRGYKAFASKMVQEAIQAIIDGSPAASEIDVDSIIDGLSAMAYPADGTDVSHANQLYAMDKLAKIRNCYSDRKPDLEKLHEIRQRMSEEEVAIRTLICRIRTDQLSEMNENEIKLRGLLDNEPELTLKMST